MPEATYPPTPSGASTETLTVRERAIVDDVIRALRSVRHGYVQLIVQDSRVVQIDAVEKRRLDHD